MKQDSVVIKVPATTANIGPGFDTLGVALELYNLVGITPVPGNRIRITSPLIEAKRGGATSMILRAANLFFERARQSRFGFEVCLTGDIPLARGLGSSVTVRLGVVAALNELTHRRLDRPVLLELVSQLEGHPDNAAPAVFGGFAVAGLVGKSVRSLAFPVDPRLKFVTLIPKLEISTKEARNLVPHSFSKSDTVHNVNRAALISAAFASGNFGQLRGLFDDRIHQPYRARLIPQLFRVIEAGEKVGAIGGWLSGSGSTIICVTTEKAETVGAEMHKQLPDSDVLILKADNKGYQVVEG